MNDNRTSGQLPGSQLGMVNDGPLSKDTCKQALVFSDFEVSCFPRALTHHGDISAYRPRV